MDVILRYGFGAPTPWAGEMSAYLLAVTVSLGLAYTQQENAHVRIDFLLCRLPKRFQDWIEVINSVLFLFVAITLCYLTWKNVVKSYTLKSTGLSLWNPLIWPGQAFISLGFALISLLLICNIYTEIKMVLSKNRKIDQAK